MLRLTIVAAVACLAFAQNNSSATDPNVSIWLQVQQERLLSERYLSSILKFQHAQHNSLAASFFLQEAQLQQKQDSGSRSFEEESIYIETQNLGDSIEHEQAKLDLQAVLNLLHANLIRQHQILIQSPLVEAEYYAGRDLQLRVQSLGQGASSSLVQLSYLQGYVSQLKTLKFALSLQVVHFFRTWLEDEIDVGTAIVERVPNFKSVAEEQEDDLINDRLYAFNALHSYATIDFQIFMMEAYLQQLSASVMSSAGAAAAASSFLEEEVQEGAEAGNQFFPFMGAAGGQSYAAYFTYLKYYFLSLQVQGATNALHSAQLEQNAYKMERDDDPSNDREAATLRSQAQHAFTEYAQSLASLSQIENMAAMFDMYSLYGGQTATPTSTIGAKNN